MKRLLSVLLLSFLFVQSITAQTSATQVVTVKVSPIYKLSISGDLSLTISDGTAGEDALTSVSDAVTTYSITHNSKTGLTKITAQITDVGGALPTDIVLKVTLVSIKGSTAGPVDISDGTAKDVVTSIAKGADANKTIIYSLSAKASAGELASTGKTVTLTLTD
jgi:hypothetical protein